jgi:signal recognition particle receptor subunit beta
MSGRKKGGGNLQVIFKIANTIKNLFMLPLNLIVKCLAPPERRQILLLGPQGSGKTTLLYRLKIPNWKFGLRGNGDGGMADAPPFNQNAEERRTEDPSYHYEEFTSRDGMEYGVWDLPGDLRWQRLWPTFYRFQVVHAIVFIVDGQDEDALNIQQTKASFRQLLSEDELRNAAFVVVVNDKKKKFPGKDGSEGQTITYNMVDDPWMYELGIDETSDRLHRSVRPAVFYHVFDIKDVKGANEDANWLRVIADVKEHIRIGEA